MGEKGLDFGYPHLQRMSLVMEQDVALDRLLSGEVSNESTTNRMDDRNSRTLLAWLRALLLAY